LAKWMKTGKKEETKSAKLPQLPTVANSCSRGSNSYTNSKSNRNRSSSFVLILVPINLIANIYSPLPIATLTAVATAPLLSPRTVFQTVFPSEFSFNFVKRLCTLTTMAPNMLTVVAVVADVADVVAIIAAVCCLLLGTRSRSRTQDSARWRLWLATDARLCEN